MENCGYHGKTLCSYELKDEHGFYEENLVLEWKEAASKRQLTCVECGAPVYLAAGVIKEPYFSHYDRKECAYFSNQESEELLQGKRLLYHLLKRSFLASEVRARYLLGNGLYSGLYCENTGELPMAMDIRLQNSSLEQFRIRNDYYISNQIRPIYILGIRMLKDHKQNDWFGHLIQSTMGYLIYMNSMREEVTLRKTFRYHLGFEKQYEILEKTYSMKELKINPDGTLDCDFYKECNCIEIEIQEKIRRYQEKKDMLKLLEEERALLQEKENQRYERYRREIRIEELKKAIEEKKQGLHLPLLEKCKQMVEDGQETLVSQKYYEVVLMIKELEEQKKENIYGN